MVTKKTLAILAAATVTGATATASAGGLYFTDRGVRPLGRGGAFVAGADDAGSIAYNPAGLAFTGNQFLLDASWLQYSATYQRKAILRQVDPNTGKLTGQEWEQTYDSVDGTTPVLPIPTIVYADNFGQENFNFAIGMWAPYAAIVSFPETVRGQPAPQRYSIISLNGSALAIPGAYVSWHEPNSPIALGAGLEMLTGYFQTSVYFSACVPERFICAPEQPDYDSYARLRVGPIFAPSGTVGAILLPSDTVRIGASFHLPFWVNAHATQDVRLPSAAVFQNASVEGDSATVKFRLPWTARAGIELRPTEDIRMEAGVGYEAWSMHDTIHVESDEIALVNVAGFPQRYRIAPVDIQRGFQDSYSARVGGELGFPVSSYRLVGRAGVTYEKSAVPKEYLSAASIDLDKIVFAVGGSLHIGKWRFDGVVAHVLASSATVGVKEQRVEQVNPVVANPPANPNYINAGSYSASANVLGLGLAYQFDSPDEPPTRPSAAAPEKEPETRTQAPQAEKKAATPEGDEAFEKAFEEQEGDKKEKGKK